MAQEKPLTLVTSPRLPDFKYREKWEVVMSNKDRFILNEKQMFLLKREIKKGNRGLVIFPEFAINIPYIISWQLIRRWQPQRYKPVDPLGDQKVTDSNQSVSRKKVDEYRQQLYKILGRWK